MSHITFHVEIDNYKKKDGTSNIQIRVTQNRRSKRITIGMSILHEHWNAEKSEVRKGNPQYRQINNLIKSKILELQKKYLDGAVLNQTMTADNLISRLRKEVMGESFIEFALARVKKMVSPNTRKGQGSIINKLIEYQGGRELYFTEVNYEYLINYERHLRKLNNGANTIHSNMKTIKAIYNEALNSGYFIPENGSPWKVYKPKKEKSKRSRLSEAQILAIENLVIRPGINEWHSKNIFLMSFYLQGMRTADILQLKWEQVKVGRVEYEAGKTGKFRSKKIIPRAQEILAQYDKNGIQPTEYIFPFLKGRNKAQFSEDDWLKVISSSNALINGHLATIAKKIGVRNISMHVARHSFADIAKKKTGNVFAVSDALDHSSVSITENYFNAATTAENDDLVDSVYGK